MYQLLPYIFNSHAMTIIVTMLKKNSVHSAILVATWFLLGCLNVLLGVLTLPTRSCFQRLICLNRLLLLSGVPYKNVHVTPLALTFNV